MFFACWSSFPSLRGPIYLIIVQVVLTTLFYCIVFIPAFQPYCHAFVMVYTSLLFCYFSYFFHEHCTSSPRCSPIYLINLLLDLSLSPWQILHKLCLQCLWQIRHKLCLQCLWQILHKLCYDIFTNTSQSMPLDH